METRKMCTCGSASQALRLCSPEARTGWTNSGGHLFLFLRFFARAHARSWHSGVSRRAGGLMLAAFW